MKDLENKRALVTGATSGIGKAITLSLLEEGIFVYCLGRSFEKLKEELEIESRSHLYNYKLIKVDFTDDQSLAKVVTELQRETYIDIIVHCAGIISVGLLENESIGNLDNQYKVNVRAPYYLNQKLVDKVKKSKGDIIFINSTAALDSWETISQYASTKFAVRAMADSLRKELKKDGVRVTNLYLGSVDTPMQQKLHKLKGSLEYKSEKYMSPSVIADAVTFILKMPNQASVTDITIRQYDQSVN